MLTSRERDAAGMPDVPTVSHAQCAKYIVKQSGLRGEGGVLYIRGSDWAYLLPKDWPHGTFYTNMERAIEQDGGKSFFVVTHPMDGLLSVFSIEKQTAALMCLEE